jgi:exosortase
MKVLRVIGQVARDARARLREVQLTPRSTLFAAVLLIAGIAYRELIGWDPGRDLAEEGTTLFVPSNTSPAFILGLSALFLYQRIDRLRRATSFASPSGWGWTLLAVAIPIYLWSIYTGATDLLLISLIPGVLGGAALLAGWSLARALLLPVAFLIFAYPIPAVLTNMEVYAFQSGAASLSTWVLDLLGRPVVLEGDLIYTRDGIFEVIETCSGLRITETLTASAFAYGELVCKRRLHTAIIVILAPLLGFLLNSVRILMIIFDPFSVRASDHTIQGLVVIVVGVLCFALIEAVLLRVLPLKPDSSSSSAEEPSPRSEDVAHLGIPRVSAQAWGVLLVVSGMASVSLWAPVWTSSAPPAIWEMVMPIQWKGWKARALEVDRTFLGSVFFSRRVYRRYEKDGVWVDTFAAKDERLQRDRSILSPKTALPGAGWSIREMRSADFDWSPVGVDEIVASKRGERILIYHWREGSLGTARESLRAVLALENSPLRTPGELRVFRLATPLSSEPDALQRARDRLSEFGPALRDSVRIRREGQDT